MQTDTILIVGTVSCPVTIQRKGPTPKPSAAITPDTKRNGMKRWRAISARRARRTCELNRRRTIVAPAAPT